MRTISYDGENSHLHPLGQKKPSCGYYATPTETFPNNLTEPEMRQWSTRPYLVRDCLFIYVSSPSLILSLSKYVFGATEHSSMHVLHSVLHWLHPSVGFAIYLSLFNWNSRWPRSASYILRTQGSCPKTPVTDLSAVTLVYVLIISLLLWLYIKIF